MQCLLSLSSPPLSPGRSMWACGHQHPDWRRCADRGFTLVELLVVVAIIAMLIGLLVPVVSRVRQATGLAKELSAARQLAAAFQAYTYDHDGYVMPGYATTTGVRDEGGEDLGFPINARYPWRLAPYLNFDFGGIHTDSQVAAALENGLDRATWQYVISLYPSLGMNTVFVGGHEGSWGGFNDQFQRVFGRIYVRSMSEPRKPSELIVFASSRGPNESNTAFQGPVIQGWYWLQPPRFTQRLWSEAWDEDDAPVDFGYVSLRHSRSAACAFFDGSVRALDEGAMQDMRHWANGADRYDWQLTPR